MQVGRKRVADLAEAQQRLQQAELDLSVAENDIEQYDSRAIKLVDVARRRYETQEAAYKEGRITIDRIFDASLQLAEAEMRTARTPYEGMSIKKRHLDRLKKIEEREEVEVKNGRATKADLAEATMRCVEAEMDLHAAITVKSTPDLSPILRGWANSNARSRSFRRIAHHLDIRNAEERCFFCCYGTPNMDKNRLALSGNLESTRSW